MSFDWLHYLDLANELYQQSATSAHQDADLRSSISRAYYCVFHKARLRLLQKWNISISRTVNPHNQVRIEFFNKKYKRIAANLDRMRAYRNKADYQDSVASLGYMASETLRRANQVIAELKNT